MILYDEERTLNKLESSIKQEKGLKSKEYSDFSNWRLQLRILRQQENGPIGLPPDGSYQLRRILDALNRLSLQVVGRSLENLGVNETLQELSPLENTVKGHDMVTEPGILIGFLLEIGRWAKSELNERWKLRRALQEADLTNGADVETTLPTQIENIARDKSLREIEEITALIERKRDAIYRTQNSKLADREEYDQQKLTKSAFEQREKEYYRTIQQMLNEIATDLEDLGFDVDRGSA